jgi:hypothetical protein
MYAVERQDNRVTRNNWLHLITYRFAFPLFDVAFSKLAFFQGRPEPFHTHWICS